MTQREKLIDLKDSIIYLYEKEGRSKSYIARLFSVERKVLSELIDGWGLVQATKRHLTPAKVKFLNKHRKDLIDMLDSDVNLSEIARRLDISFKTLLDTYIKNDKELFHHYTLRDLRVKNKVEASKDERKRKSRLEYNIIPIEGEEWKEVLGFPLYQVSNFGRIKSYVARYDAYYLVKSCPNTRTGRYYIRLSNDDGSKNLSLPRIVAHAFVSGYSEINNTVNHIDGDFSNNKATNLEWVSQSENNKKAFDLGKGAVIAHSKHGKFKSIILDGNYEFKTIRAMAKFLNVSETQCHRYIDGECSSPHTFKFIY